ncbi:MAG: phosphoglycerate dehydrogenase, partial [Actinomycetales bacterium]
PHVGGSTEEAQQDIGRFVASKLKGYAAFGSTSLSVTFPELTLPAGVDVHRLALVHQNAPGVLASINAVLGEHAVNIEKQSLATRGQIGYVVTDVAQTVPDAVLTELAGLPETISLRQIS